VTGIALLALSPNLFSQEPNTGKRLAVAIDLPETPQPQAEFGSVDLFAQQTSPAQQTGTEKSQHEKGEEEIKEEEKQRVVGVVPSFNVSYRADTVSLSGFQKLRLAFHSAVDPAAFAAGLVVAGYHQAMDDDTGFGWGLKGYAKRSSAAYLDAADGTMIGNGILPAILHQEPRYLRLGHGTYTHRLFYSIATNFVCPHDNTHKWEPNYSNVLGNIVAGAISNLYYPSGNSGFGLTITNGLIDTGEGTFGTVFEEFWPDLSRRYLHKDPTQGRDAEARALDVEEKQVREEQKKKRKQDKN